MLDIYCHVHTPVHIGEERKDFLEPILYSQNLYIIKSKKLEDILVLIGLFPEYIKFIREFGYNDVPKWLIKKDLLNEGFLEAVSQYWIENPNHSKITNYRSFKKNSLNKPTITDQFIKNLFKKVILYEEISQNKELFNINAEYVLNLVEKEISSIENPTLRKQKIEEYKTSIFQIFIDEYFFNDEFEEKLDVVNHLNFSCETLLTQNDLSIYRVGNIEGFSNFSFKISNTSHIECLRENTFVKLCASCCYDHSHSRYLMEGFKSASQIFTSNFVNFGIEMLENNLSMKEFSNANKQNFLKTNRKFDSGNTMLLEKSRTIISETEDHIIARLSSLKNNAGLYFATCEELLKLVTVLNLDKHLLKRLNMFLWKKPDILENQLIKFAFKKGDLPYSTYGFASLIF